MTLDKILENIQKQLNNEGIDLDISFGLTSWNESHKKYICGILYKDDDGDIDYKHYEFGSTVENAIINFYNKIINNKNKNITSLTLHNKPKKIILNKNRNITKNFNIRKG